MYNDLNRMAYLVGNNNYNHLNRLNGSINDTNLIELALKKCGFYTKKFTDLNYDNFRECVNEFKYNCIKYDVGLFYFAGHGFEYFGENYLCPIDSCLDKLKDTNINILGLVNEVSKDRDFVSIIILDCCRDTITERNITYKSINDMVPNFKNNGGTYVAYATTSGESALEQGNHGIYTESLCKHITAENQQIEQVFKKVRKDIISATASRNMKIQIPWEYSSLVNEFYFMKRNELSNIDSLVQDAIEGQLKIEQIKQKVISFCLTNNIVDHSGTLYEVLNKIDKNVGDN